jgi:hypothetical protein
MPIIESIAHLHGPRYFVDYEEPMEVHPPHHPLHTWKDFFIHIATISVGLLIAVGLEQSVEALHHRHQRHQLQEDLREEAEKNREVIARDLKMRDLEPWFEAAAAGVDKAVPQQGKVQFTLPKPPCIPGTVGTAAVRYFAPSEAVWTTAKESGLTELLPVEESRMYARLGHNYVLLAQVRDDVFKGCSTIAALRHRFAKSADGDNDVWTMTDTHAEELAKAAAETQVSIQALLFRLRWSDVYEDAITRGEARADIKMMTVNQEQFEDAPGR